VHAVFSIGRAPQLCTRIRASTGCSARAERAGLRENWTGIFVMSAERLQCPAALELGSALSGSNLQLFAHAAVATLWRNSELDRQIFDMNLIPGLQQAIVRLTADRWCEVCTPAHFNSGNLIDVHSLEKFRSTPRYNEYRQEEINYGIKHALRVYTVSAEEELFTAIEAFDDIRVFTPPMGDSHFRQHVRVVGGSCRVPEAWEISLAKRVAPEATGAKHPSHKTTGFAVVDARPAMSTDMRRYIVAYCWHDSFIHELVLDVPTRTYISVCVDQLKELIKKAEANHKDESRDVVLIEGAAGTPKEREEQRELLRRSVGSVSARRFQE
jgi:hypothetical protein